MDTELLKGTLSLLILSLLSRKPMYGYELAATVHKETDGTFTWREGSLYPSLHKMQADGLQIDIQLKSTVAFSGAGLPPEASSCKARVPRLIVTVLPASSLRPPACEMRSNSLIRPMSE